MEKGFLDKKSREDFIDYIEKKDNLFKEESNYFSVVWEVCLVSDYWKGWRKKIRMLPSEEVVFFSDRLLELRSRILWTIRSYRKDKWNDDYTRKLVEVNERELENITEKEFYSNKPKNGVRELTVEEISDMLRIWTKDQLISEINRLKAENEQLKNNQTLTSSEKQERLQKNQQKLSELESSILNSSSSDNSNNKSSSNLGTFALITGVLVLAGVITYSVIKPKKIKKSR